MVQLTESSTDQQSKDEELWLQEIMNAFQTVTPQTITAVSQPHKPDLSPRVRSLQKPKSRLTANDAVTVFDQQQTVVLNKHQKTVEEVAITMDVPETTSTAVEKQSIIDPQQSMAVTSQTGVFVSSDTNTIIADEPTNDSQSALFNTSLPFPSKPTEPNKVVGMILTPNNELIPDAIIEIVDQNNRVARAVKSNALGQFFVTTPLHGGQYTLRVEHDRYQFPSLELKVQNEIIDPVEIRSLG